MASEFCNLKIDDIIFVEKLYPRFDMDNNAVEQYRLNLEALPPIVISQNHILIDGKHRLRAYQLSKKEEIPVEILDMTDETEILKETIKRNSTHGKQLDMKEKKSLAQKLFSKVAEDEMIALLAVSKRVIYDWTKDQRQEQKDEEKKKIIDLYLKCWTQERIASEIGISIGTVNGIVSKIADMQKLKTPPDSLQRYDVWNFNALDKTYGQAYPGRIPGQILENILWYFTKPLDVVCDPMVGGGTTIDVCKAMYRRYLGFDVNVVHDCTIKHNILDGWPDIPETYQKANLIFMDPPYFKKKATEYNLPEEYNTKDGFMKFAEAWVEFSRQAISKDGIVILLISDYVDYDNPRESIFSDEYAKLFESYFSRLYKISVPLSTQQYQAFHVTRAEEQRRLLIIGRELYIFKYVR